MHFYNREYPKLWVVCFWISLFFAQTSYGQKEYQFRRLSVLDGLSQNEVTSIIQDDYGFMWFGTRGGLNRYDGYQFKQFKPNRNDSNSIVSPSIETLYKNSSGDIYIGTKSSSWCSYSKINNSFIRHTPQADYKRITNFLEDDDQNIWFSDWNNGAFCLINGTDSIESFFPTNRINTIIQTPDNTIWCGGAYGLKRRVKGGVFEDFRFKDAYHEISEMVYDSTHNCIWIVGWDLGLVRFDCETLTFEQYKIDSKINKYPNTYCLLLENEKYIWVGTWGNGLLKFDIQTSSFSPIKLAPNKLNATIDDNIILEIFRDKVGDFWIGTDGGGIIHLSEKNNFENLQVDNHPTQMHVNAIHEDGDGAIWIGTKGNGLWRYMNNNLTRVSFEQSNYPENEDGSIVKSITEDEDGQIWVGISNGLYHISNRKGLPILKNTYRNFVKTDPQKLYKVLDIQKSGNELWIASQQRGLSLFRFANGRYTLRKSFSASNNDDQLKDNRITSIMSKKNGELWVASYNGIYQYNAKDSTFKDLKQFLAPRDYPLSNIILSTHLDRNENIWFGTPCGLIQIKETGNNQFSIKSYDKSDGLPDDYINGIESDSENNIWVSTNSGISRLNTQLDEWHNFNNADGIGSVCFSESASCISTDGKIYFGGHEGVTFFDPEQIVEKKRSPEIAVTKFNILNKEVPITPKGTLTQNINQEKHIVLSYKQHEFSFEFSALDYKAPEQNRYAYQLEGFNDEPVFIGARRHVSFSNLKTGEYTLHLKGTNSNGKWSSKDFTLKIKVLPAPWKTWYALVFYLSVIAIIIWLISKIRLKQERLQNRIRLECVRREKQNEVNEYKLNFFTTISHELRTPLTLILAPINELLANNVAELDRSTTISKLKLIQTNADKLTNLINQLLEFRKIESGKLKLRPVRLNIKHLIQKITDDYQSYATTNDVTFEVKFTGQHWSCLYDSNKISTVINNLLINAFKYCATPGIIQIEVEEHEHDITIEIVNNGQGIPPNEIKHIFDIYFQPNNHQTQGSTGLGLALVKKYVELHHGTITAESNLSQETRFSIKLSKKPTYDKGVTIEQDELKEFDFLKKLTKPLSQKQTLNKNTTGEKVLIVEDNQDVQAYLCSFLGNYFEILRANNGHEGLEMAIKHQPAVVISDVVMPELDGLEMSKKIKTHEQISHIPIILLTAKDREQDQILGARNGADIYMTKPFNPELLLEKTKLLIASRKDLSKKYSKKMYLAEADKEIDDRDEKFLKRVTKLIETNIHNRQFDSELLAREMGMSASTFYRKTKKTLNQTPGEVIKNIRLKYAAQKLLTTDMNISEIAEDIGYTDLKSFRKSFKHLFEMTPKEYRQKNQQG